MLPSAVILAGVVVVAWSVLTVSIRATLYGFAFEPWSLALAVQICGGAVLLFAAGIRSPPLEPIRRWATWVIGGLRVVTTCAFTTALLHASAGQVSLLTTINVLIAMLGVFVVFRRRRHLGEIPGILMMIAGLILLVGHLEGGCRDCRDDARRAGSRSGWRNVWPRRRPRSRSRCRWHPQGRCEGSCRAGW